MKIEFDQESDAMYIQLREGKIYKSKEASGGIVIDYDKKKKVVGIEILDASRKIPPKEISFIDLKFPVLKTNKFIKK